ncbi:MAG: hypothetical protein ABEJ36_01125 [Candidatus Nanosalina sp.]
MEIIDQLAGKLDSVQLMGGSVSPEEQERVSQLINRIDEMVRHDVRYRLAVTDSEYRNQLMVVIPKEDTDDYKPEVYEIRQRVRELDGLHYDPREVVEMESLKLYADPGDQIIDLADRMSREYVLTFLVTEED